MQTHMIFAAPQQLRVGNVCVTLGWHLTMTVQTILLKFTSNSQPYAYKMASHCKLLSLQQWFGDSVPLPASGFQLQGLQLQSLLLATVSAGDTAVTARLPCSAGCWWAAAPTVNAAAALT
jgi:hypothetical protein